MFIDNVFGDENCFDIVCCPSETLNYLTLACVNIHQDMSVSLSNFKILGFDLIF